MSKAFYPKLAAQNCVKNGKFYFPYLLTVIFSAAAFYINVALTNMPDMPDMIRYEYLSSYMAFGSVILGLFIVIFLVYTNSFLMKRRVKELGLYNVLGMGKKSIGVVLSFESLYTWLVGVGAGLAIGMLLQKLMTLLAQKLMQVDTVFHYYISARAMLVTALFFGGVLLLTLLINLRKLHVQKPVELLRGGSTGEREPKTRWLLTVIGVLSLGMGYYLALTPRDVMSALSIYFVAVFLVIIGTYCLFSAVSIAILKALRKNKKFYYKTGNFIGLSGMLHRMNRNAVGLGNICILSTMVLVMISSTLSLYLGTEDSLNSRYPAQLNVEVRYSAKKGGFNTEKAESNMREAVESEGLGVTKIMSYSTNEPNMAYENGTYKDVDYGTYSNRAQFVTVIFLTAADYEKLSGEQVELKSDQAMLLGAKAETEDVSFVFYKKDSGETQTREVCYQLLQGDESFMLSEFSVYASRIHYIVLPGQQDLMNMSALKCWGDNSYGLIKWNCLIDTDGTPEQQLDCAVRISDAERAKLSGDEELNWEWFSVSSREENSIDFYSTNGGFFFLGIFLGSIFIMAMVLIMYYKQISEGYEDRERFRIMQQVGLPKRDIRRSINVQVLIVFFAPLIVAGIHVVFDFNLVRKLLTLFGMLNWRLAALCTLATFGVFALLYAAVYALTAKTYYNIVSEKNAE